MRFYSPSIKTELVRDVITAWVRTESRLPASLAVALKALDVDLQRVEAELQRIKAEDAAEEARKHPALTVQKVGGILRRAKLPISSYDGRIGASGGIEVSYGDMPRTWIKVSRVFEWNFGYNKQVRGKAEEALVRKLVADQLFGKAQDALKAAGLDVTPVTSDQPRLAYLSVKAS